MSMGRCKHNITDRCKHDKLEVQGPMGPEILAPAEGLCTVWSQQWANSVDYQLLCNVRQKDLDKNKNEIMFIAMQI